MIREGRRPSESLIPIAFTKKGKRGTDDSEQIQFDFDATGERRERNTLINDLRRDLAKWRRGGEYAGVTPISRKLLQHSADPNRENRVLFCQREAAETAIFLTELAGRSHAYPDWRARLDPENASHNSGLPRMALKMATGSGKTVLMAMLIAWQTVNKVQSPELKRELTRCLRTGRAVRKPRRRDGQRQPRLRDMVNISDRPAEVADRALPGHWEGDLILGKNNRSAIGTLVERKTRFTVLLHLPGDHTAACVRDAMITAMGQIPQILRKTLTWDQGPEITEHLKIADALDLDIYFCGPASPWQRASNENTVSLVVARLGWSGRLVPAA